MLVVASIISMLVFGINLGIDFTGGSVLEVEYSEGVPEKQIIENALVNFGLDSFVLRATGNNGYIIKTKSIDDATKVSIERALTFDGANPLEVKRFNTIGPTLGSELKSKASVALLVVAFAIVIFIAYTFRHVSKPVSSWKYGFVAIIALAHDIIITLGFFALLGGIIGTEINTLFITALLVILGYSINDTIVVLDRIRENLRGKDDNYKQAKFAEIVNQSLKETFARSINTSITTLLALFALFIIGGESTKDFALALIVGVISGAYSSLFLAAPLLVSFKERQEK